MKTILIIEDEDTLRGSVARMLGFEGFGVVEAVNGPQGVEMARLHHPDLILCDVMIPGLDGFGVAEKLRDDPSTASIPFVFLTGKAEKEAVQRGVEMGISAYITKPFTLTELLDAINDNIQ